MQSLLSRLYRTKLLLSSFVLMVTGIALLTISNALDHQSLPTWVHWLPIAELGGILIGAGLLSVWLDYFLKREQTALDELPLRRLLSEQAPQMRDAVLEAFAADRDDLARVATPELLDNIISNSLGLRLKDQQFASEIYTDIRDQAVMASERWHDARLSIDLSPLPMGRGSGTTRTPTRVTQDWFSVTIRWEYVTVPSHPERRFVCLSDRTEYVEAAAQRGATSAWFLGEAHGLDASLPSSFELLSFTVDGTERPIRRAQRKHGQVYSASVGADVVSAGEPVTITYSYRTIVRKAGHLLFLDVEQPTRNLAVDLDYGGTDITTINVLDLVPSVRPTRLERPSGDGSGPHTTIRSEIDGWIFPRSGIAFVWSLSHEEKPQATSSRRAA